MCILYHPACLANEIFIWEFFKIILKPSAFFRNLKERCFHTFFSPLASSPRRQRSIQGLPLFRLSLINLTLSMVFSFHSSRSPSFSWNSPHHQYRCVQGQMLIRSFLRIEVFGGYLLQSPESGIPLSTQNWQFSQIFSIIFSWSTLCTWSFICFNQT